MRVLWLGTMTVTLGTAASFATADCPCRGGGAMQFVSQGQMIPAPPAPGLSQPQGLPIAPIPETQPGTRPMYAPPQGTPYSAPQMAPGMSPTRIQPQPQFAPSPSTSPQGMSPQPQPQFSASPTASPMDAGTPTVNRFNVSPPPGTLGQTYLRRSSLPEDTRHPRYAAVDVHLPENVDVSARGLKAKWTGEVWRLEAETPLLPGVPHIYAIKAERDGSNGQKTTDVRWVRLIMGRIVELEF